MSSSNIIVWKMKFFWTLESKRAYSLYLLYLIWTLISRKICSLNSVLTILSLNASEAPEIKTNCFLTSSVLNSLYCSNLLYYNFSSSEVSLQYLTSKLYITIESLYLQICFLTAVTLSSVISELLNYRGNIILYWLCLTSLYSLNTL